MDNVEQLKANYKNSLPEKAEMLNTLFNDWQSENNEQTQTNDDLQSDSRGRLDFEGC